MLHAVPEEANYRLVDMLSDSTSNETKAATARWYAEMMVDKFLSDEAKKRLTLAGFKKLSLGEAIDEIKKDYSTEVVDALYLIKSVGDRSAHYKKDSRITSGEAESVVSKSLRLFNIIMADELAKFPLDATNKRATLFSTLLPAVREDVLLMVINSGGNSSEYQSFLVHKYMLAGTKNGNIKKVMAFLKRLLRRGEIKNIVYEFEVDSARAIALGMERGELPVPRNLADTRRNFDMVLKEMPVEEIAENERLISIIERLLDEVSPSDMGKCVGGIWYVV